ncbi:uncharacterized protein [Ptychodera flava]|uniref:uncharacterized protein n=1 Tax=Ptychodera flava TaxID=63121 RepID=UPI003969DF30
MASYLGDRDLVLKLASRFKELMFDESTMQKFNQRCDPQNSDASKWLGIMMDIEHEVASVAFAEYGVDTNQLTERFLKTLRQNCGNDKEISELISCFLPYGAQVRVGDLRVGDERPDVELLHFQTKEKIPLSKLHINKERPLVVIASSIS